MEMLMMLRTAIVLFLLAASGGLLMATLSPTSAQLVGNGQWLIGRSMLDAGNLCGRCCWYSNNGYGGISYFADCGVRWCGHEFSIPRQTIAIAYSIDVGSRYSRGDGVYIAADKHFLVEPRTE